MISCIASWNCLKSAVETDDKVDKKFEFTILEFKRTVLDGPTLTYFLCISKWK